MADSKTSEHEAREYAESIINTMREPLIVLDHDLKVVTASRSFYDAFKVSPEETEGQLIYDLGNKQWDIPQLRELLETIIPQKTTLDDYEIEHEFADTGRRTMLVNAREIQRKSGKERLILLAIEDITERKRLENLLSESEERYRRLFETANDGIVLLEKAEGKITHANPAIAEMFGYSHDEFIGKKVIDIGFPGDIGTIQEISQTLEKDGILHYKDAPVQTKAGQVIDTDIYMVDKARLVQCNIRDITERKRAEEELRENEEKYRSILNSIEDGYFEVDLAGNLTFFNDSMCRMLGYSSLELMGTNNREYMDKNNAQKVFQAFNQVFTTGESLKTFDWELIRKDGKKFYVDTSVSLMRDTNGKAIGFRGVARDITKRKKAEAEREKLQVQLNQAQKMESVGQLAGGVAHDFNNKLTIINGYAEMAIDMMDPSDPLRETIQEIHTAGEQSATIVRQLLAFARQQTISPVQLNLNGTISGMLKMLQRLIGENIDLKWHPDNNLWPVKIDPSQVDQIMANLAVNARDAISDVGKLTIETENTIVDEDYCKSNSEAIPGRYVMLAVSDDGCGIEKETMDQLFEPFFTTKAVGKGSGLGLPTIYGIVKQNKGFINVYSEPGEGTTFKLYFPSCERKKASVHSTNKSTGHTPTGSEAILLVEDEKAILQMSRRMLERLGYTVQTASNPFEALKLAEEYDGTIHLLLTDVVMSEMNGRDLSSRLIQICPGIKTLYMSGYTSNVIVHHGVLDEGVQFIQKPFSIQDLAVKVRKVIEAESE